MYEFLKHLVIEDPGRKREPATKNPKGNLALRLFKDGSVYPSQELVDKFSLEYVRKDSVYPGNGIDFFLSKEWTPLAAHPNMLIMGFVSKDQPKVDLFGSCRYNDDGSPKSSVMTQGLKSLGLVDAARQLGYLAEDQAWVDLQVVVDVPIPQPANGIVYVPKTVERGERKGEPTYERRENVIFYPVNTTENLKQLQTENETNNKVEGEPDPTPSPIQPMSGSSEPQSTNENEVDRDLIRWID